MPLEKKTTTKNCAFSDNGEPRTCDDSCAAFAIMAIPRSRLVFDSVLKVYNIIADREPFHGPFCRRGNFPIGLDSDDFTILGPQKKTESNMDVR